MTELEIDLGKCLMARKRFVVLSAFTQFLVVKYPSITTIILRISVSLTSLKFFFFFCFFCFLFFANIKFIFTSNLTFVIILGFSIKIFFKGN